MKKRKGKKRGRKSEENEGLEGGIGKETPIEKERCEIKFLEIKSACFRGAKVCFLNFTNYAVQLCYKLDNFFSFNNFSCESSRWFELDLDTPTQKPKEKRKLFEIRLNSQYL